jgi:VanZ family protein
MTSRVAVGRVLRRARATPGRRLSLLMICILSYALVSLWPFTWSPPRLVDNGARWATDGSLHFASPGLAITPTAPGWLAIVQETGRLEVTLAVRPLESSQGDANILSIGRNIYDSNLHLAQQGSHLLVRLRRACRNHGVWPRRCQSTVRASNVFEAGQRVELAISIVPGRLLLRADGHTMESDLPPDALRLWDDRYRLSLGNDVSGSRPWLGEIARATVGTPGGERDYLMPSRLTLPEVYWSVEREPKLVPFRYVPPRDALNNFILYMPFGILLALLGYRQGSWAALLAFAVIGSASLVMEAMQLFVASRTPSITDLLLNTAGGTLAFAACHLSWRRRHGRQADAA